MTAASVTAASVTVIAWTLVAGRLVMLGTRRLRARPASAEGWHPRVTSGCGR